MLHRPAAGKNERTLTVGILALSAAVAIAILAARNLYDDELMSLWATTSTPRQILHDASTGDVHPPGMYLLAHLAFQLVPSFRWMNLVPLVVLYAGLGLFVVQTAPLFRRTSSRVLFLALAALHPQLLLWGTSFRWYSWWTGLALVVLVLALQPREPSPTLSPARAAALGALLATLFYLNYITLLFVPALCAAVALRYRRNSVGSLRNALLTLAVFAIAIAPQAVVFLRTHLARNGEQRSAVLPSFARLLQGTFASEAFLPWHPLAIVAALTLISLLVFGLLRQMRADPAEPPASNPEFLHSIGIFSAVFFVLVAISGLGGKSRNGLLLVPCIAVVLAQAAETLSSRAQRTAIALVALWSAVGIGHMIARTGLSRSMMVERPEQVAAFVRSTAPDGCAVIVTTSSALAFATSHPRDLHVVLLSVFSPPLANTPDVLPPECSRVNLYLVHTYVPGSANWATQAESQLDSAARLTEGQPQTTFLSPDSDAPRKRSLSRMADLGSRSADQPPDFRYVVVSGPIARSALPTLRSRLPDFCTPRDCATR